MGQLQLVPQSAQVPLRLGPHDAQLRVDVFVLVPSVFLVLKNKQTSVSLVFIQKHND